MFCLFKLILLPIVVFCRSFCVCFASLQNHFASLCSHFESFRCHCVNVIFLYVSDISLWLFCISLWSVWGLFDLFESLFCPFASLGNNFESSYGCFASICSYFELHCGCLSPLCILTVTSVRHSGLMTSWTLMFLLLIPVQ